jgi:hypothetical protein
MSARAGEEWREGYGSDPENEAARWTGGTFKGRERRVAGTRRCKNKNCAVLQH